MSRWIFLLLFFVSIYAVAQDKPVALTGTLVTPDEIIPNGTLLIQNGRIAAVGAHVSVPEGATIVATNGIIAPGLIDLHNHLTWNIFPRWKPIEEFGNRYDWQQKPVYNVLMTAPHAAIVSEGLECAAERYAEVKAITQGETSVIGSLHGPCNSGLARNLDDDPSLGRIIYNVFPFRMTETELKDAKDALAAHGSLFIHVAEGAPNDASAAREFAMLKGRGLLTSGVSLIHAVALKPEDFAEMSKSGVGFVWSPRSNIELYGDTANVAAAKANNVVTALAPDWSPTGSEGLLSELNYAATWVQSLKKKPEDKSLFDDKTLLTMATANPAKLAHIDDKLGQLKPGYLADILVLHPHGEQFGHDAYWAVTHATPEDISLVMIDGKAVYGDPDVMKQLTDVSKLESLEICGVQKSISFTSEPGTQPAFRETENTLDHALHQWSQKLAPLAECRD